MLFETIVHLKTGQALLFCPTAQLEMVTSCDGFMELKALANRYTKLSIRKRTTADGGRSVTASGPSALTETCRVDVPMHIVAVQNKTVRGGSANTPNTRAEPGTQNARNGASPGPVTAKAGKSKASPAPNTQAKSAASSNREEARNILEAAFQAAKGKEEWVLVSRVGDFLYKKHPRFDSRTYGHSKLRNLIEGIPLFEVTQKRPGPGKPFDLYVRLHKTG